MLQGIVEAQSWSNRGSHPEARARQMALNLYYRTAVQRRLRQLWAALTGRSYDLLDLAEVAAAYKVHGSYHAGTQTVPLSRIQGSRGRRRRRRVRSRLCFRGTR